MTALLLGAVWLALAIRLGIFVGRLLQQIDDATTLPARPPAISGVVVDLHGHRSTRSWTA